MGSRNQPAKTESSFEKMTSVQSMLLAVGFKMTESVQYRGYISGYIEEYYGAKAARDSSEDLEILDALRSRATNEQTLTEETKERMVEYYGNLHVIEKRFPISSHTGHVNMCFQWHDAFQSDELCEMHSVHLEKAATVFNIGALCSQMAYEHEKTTVDGLKQAAKLFQESGGVFSFLREEIMPNLVGQEPTDRSPLCLQMLENIMVAQAQECVFEMALKLGKSDFALAKLSKYIADLYDAVVVSLSSKELKSHFEKSWRSLFSVKGLYYEALAYQHHATYMRGKGGDIDRCVRNELAFLQHAKELIAKAKKETYSTRSSVKETVNERYDTIIDTLKKKMDDNEKIYMQLRIPPCSELEAIEPAVVSKAETPDYLREPIGTIVFQGVIPESVTKEWSKYTDLVDKMLREHTDMLEAASDEARVALREMELPESLLGLQSGRIESIPDNIRIEVEHIEKKGGLTHLQQLLAQIQQIRLSVHEDIERCHQVLRASELASSPSIGVWHNKISVFSKNMDLARQSDNHSQEMLKKFSKQISELKLQDVAARMPVLQTPMLVMDSTEPAEAINCLRIGLNHMNTLSKQRASIEEHLRRMKHGDDIIDSLVSIPKEKSTKDVFAEHMSKYDKFKGLIRENIAKQVEVLSAMRSANAIFRQTYDFGEWEHKRKQEAEKVKDDISVFSSIEKSLQEGIQFYLNLQDAVTSVEKELVPRTSNGHGSIANEFSNLTLGQNNFAEDYATENPIFGRR
jgi:programmed cell death 6-interacting protein